MAAVPARLLKRSLALLLFAAVAVGAQTQARRIVSIIPATTEMLFAMGAGDRVVAVGTYDRFPPDVQKLPHVGALLDPDVERVIALRPDLVIVYETQTDLRTQLDRARIPYFLYKHRGLPDISETMRALGARIGMADRGNAAADRLDREVAAVKARVAALPRPKTLVVFGRERGTLRGLDASGGYGFLHDMMEAAGAANVLGELKQQAVQMSTEMVLARGPEIIIELHYARGDSTSEGDMKAWSTLPGVPAVRNKRVFLLQGEEFVVPGPRVGAATERLARIIHPESFK